MQWDDDAILLSTRKQGETSLILSLLTLQHGRHRGLLRGGAKRGERGLFQPGAVGVAHWQGRLEEHLGLARLEIMQSHAAGLLDDPLRLACLEAITSLADLALPERQTFPGLYILTKALLEALSADRGWAAQHLAWELSLLAGLGYGLTLDRCAVTGQETDLAYVSPKTGRAVSSEAGGAYREKLLILPRQLGGLIRAEISDGEDLLDGLRLTGFFLAHSALAPLGFALPEQRGRYVDRLRRMVLLTDSAPLSASLSGPSAL